MDGSGGMYQLDPAVLQIRCDTSLPKNEHSVDQTERLCDRQIQFQNSERKPPNLDFVFVQSVGARSAITIQVDVSFIQFELHLQHSSSPNLPTFSKLSMATQ